jgi:hypothetical protein
MAVLGLCIKRREGVAGLGIVALAAAKKYPVHSDPTACSRARLGMRI